MSAGPAKPSIHEVLPFLTGMTAPASHHGCLWIAVGALTLVACGALLTQSIQSTNVTVSDAIDSTRAAVSWCAEPTEGVTGFFKGVACKFAGGMLALLGLVVALFVWIVSNAQSSGRSHNDTYLK